MGTVDVEMADVLRALHQEVWAPITAALPPGTSRVILSPDGQLNFVSFAALLGPDDRFVAADYSLCYVASGRDLLWDGGLPTTVPQLTVFANPSFAARDGSVPQPTKESHPPSTARRRETCRRSG